jgi:hypothetical protein
MSTCNRWDLQTLGSRPLIKYAQKSPRSLIWMHGHEWTSNAVRILFMGDVFHAGYPRNTFSLHFWFPCGPIYDRFPQIRNCQFGTVNFTFYWTSLTVCGFNEPGEPTANLANYRWTGWVWEITTSSNLKAPAKVSIHAENITEYSSNYQN